MLPAVRAVVTSLSWLIIYRRAFPDKKCLGGRLVLDQHIHSTLVFLCDMYLFTTPLPLPHYTHTHAKRVLADGILYIYFLTFISAQHKS